MVELTERELTRLSFLMSSLVAEPSLSSRLIDRMRKDLEPPILEKMVRDLGERIQAAAGEKRPTWTTLRDVAKNLIQGENTDSRTVGRLLAAALESAPPRSSQERT